MSAQAPRQELITKLGQILTNMGWSESQESLLPQEIADAIEWSPEKVFTNPEKEWILVEIEDELNIPGWLTRTLRGRADILQKVRVLVGAVKDTPIDIETAKVALDNNILVYAGYSNPVAIVNPYVSIVKDAPEVVQSAKERFKLHKRIPSALIEALTDLKHVIYCEELRQFARAYDAKTFSDWNDEHVFLRMFLLERFAKKFGNEELFRGLEILGLFEDLSGELLGSRPHFLHSFQTFILGSILIDNNYDSLNQTYSACFDDPDELSLDLPWFFASLFHDLAVPFEKIHRLGPVGKLIDLGITGYHDTYASHLLGSWFNAVCKGPISSEWKPQSGVAADPLYGMLMKKTKDHGVLGSMSLLSSATYASSKALSTIICPAALAIAIHNSKLWPDMVEYCGFPVSAQRFPLAFLLLTCDNIEEWGREMLNKPAEQDIPGALIIDYDLSKGLGSFSLWVDEPARATVIQNRVQWLTSRLFQVGDWNINCSFFSDR